MTKYVVHRDPFQNNKIVVFKDDSSLLSFIIFDRHEVHEYDETKTYQFAAKLYGGADYWVTPIDGTIEEDELIIDLHGALTSSGEGMWELIEIEDEKKETLSQGHLIIKNNLISLGG